MIFQLFSLAEIKTKSGMLTSKPPPEYIKLINETIKISIIINCQVCSKFNLKGKFAKTIIRLQLNYENFYENNTQ